MQNGGDCVCVHGHFAFFRLCIYILTATWKTYGPLLICCNTRIELRNVWFVYIQMCKSTVAHTSPIGKLSTNMYNSTGQSIIIGFGIVSALLSYSLGVVSESNTSVAAILPSYENQAAMESSAVSLKKEKIHWNSTQKYRVQWISFKSMVFICSSSISKPFLRVVWLYRVCLSYTLCLCHPHNRGTSFPHLLLSFVSISLPPRASRLSTNRNFKLYV